VGLIRRRVSFIKHKNREKILGFGETPPYIAVEKSTLDELETYQSSKNFDVI